MATDKKISELAAKATPSPGDNLVIVDNDVSPGVNKKTTAAAFDAAGSATAAQSAAEATAANASNLTSGTVDGDRLPAMSATKKGGVPATGAPSGLFLKDDGTFAAAGGGGDFDWVETLDGSVVGGTSIVLSSITVDPAKIYLVRVAVATKSASGNGVYHARFSILGPGTQNRIQNISDGYVVSITASMPTTASLVFTIDFPGSDNYTAHGYAAFIEV